MMRIQLLGYPLADGDQELLNYINSWIDIAIESKLLDKLYNHWILGKGAVGKKPRWSVIRDVLGWVD
jgi:ABC-type amino acid transport substrate-binding protein